jgi:hypothetical protein
MGMTYSFVQDVPIDATTYAEIKAGLGTDLPPGLVVHLAHTRAEGGLRYIDVWESEEACDRFGEERLHPVVHPMLAAVFGDDMPDEPARTSIEVIDVWQR